MYSFRDNPCIINSNVCKTTSYFTKHVGEFLKGDKSYQLVWIHIKRIKEYFHTCSVKSKLTYVEDSAYDSYCKLDKTAIKNRNIYYNSKTTAT